MNQHPDTIISLARTHQAQLLAEAQNDHAARLAWRLTRARAQRQACETPRIHHDRRVHP